MFKKKTLSKLLLLVVFLTGTSVMVLEIVAIRLFAPYFGNTLYTTSSVIGVILGALSVGYYLGGWLSDRRPSYTLFFGIITVSGVLTLLLHLVHKLLLPVFATKLSFASGSIVSSLTLFLVPNILFGTLSPFTVKLRSVLEGGERAGGNSGEVFFVSTLGSICGSFLTGFYLIPTFGVNSIIVGTSSLLVVLGLVGSFLSGRKVGLFVVGFVLLFAGLLQVDQGTLRAGHNTLYAKDGVYQWLAVFEAKYEGAAARFLLQDRNSSSAMYLDSNDFVFNYPKYVSLLKDISLIPKRALVVGAGAYSIPKYLIDTYPDVIVDVVDVEPGLDALAHQYFNLQKSDRINTIVADGRRQLTETNVVYDFIFVDAFSSLYSVPSHLMSKEYFELLNHHITEDGLILSNVIGVSQNQYVASAFKTWSSAFPYTLHYMVEGKDQLKPQNNIFVASKRKYSFQQFSDHLLMSGEAAVGIIFTDDYSPVDYLISKEI